MTDDSPTISTPTPDRRIDLLDGDLYAGDPYATYAWMRENAPVYWDATTSSGASRRYDDIVEIEKDKDSSSSPTGQGGTARTCPPTTR